MSSFNDELPSSADRFVNRHEPEALDQAVQKIEDTAVYVKQQAVQAVSDTNDAVAERMSPMTGMLLAAVCGFVVGSWWSSRN